MMDDKIRAMVLEKKSSDVIKEYAKREKGMITLKEDAMKKVLEAVTSFDEALRIVF